MGLELSPSPSSSLERDHKGLNAIQQITEVHHVSDVPPSDPVPLEKDARSLLPQPFDISLPHLAGDLFTAISNLYRIIRRRVAQTKHSQRLHRRLLIEHERLFLWGHDVSVSSGHLEEVLSESYSEFCELRHAVLKIHYELGRVIRGDLLRAVDRMIQLEVSADSTESVLSDLAQSDASQQLQRLLGKAATVLLEPTARADFESQSEEGSTRYDLDEILEDVAVYIDCLMDLSPLLVPRGPRH